MNYKSDHSHPPRAALLSLVILVLLASSCVHDEEFAPDAFGNKTHRQAINFLIEECNRYTSYLNREVQSTGNATSQRSHFGQPVSSQPEAKQLPPPQGTLKELRKAAKEWKEKTPKSDKELRLIYIRFQKCFSSYEIMEKSLVDYPTFNTQSVQHQTLMNEVQAAVKAVEERPEGFKAKK